MYFYVRIFKPTNKMEEMLIQFYVAKAEKLFRKVCVGFM